MLNLYYLVPSSLILGATYLLVNKKNKKTELPIDNKKLESIKKKFNIKSTEKTTFKPNITESSDNSESKNNNTTINKNNDKSNKTKKVIPPKVDIIPIPNNCLSSNNQIENVPAKLIKKLQNDLNLKNFNIYNIVCAFLNTKLIFNKLFTESNGDNIINSIDSFISNYKNIANNDHFGYNILLKLSDDFNSEKYIYMKKNTLIKINKSDDYKLLNEIIQKEKIFLFGDKKKYHICMGDCLISNINKNQIKNIFFNKLDISDPKIASNYELFCKYNKISIIYWVSTKISNEIIN